MTDEELARRLTEALDARIDRAAEKAFPLGGRCPSAHTGADEGVYRQADASSHPAAEPVPIRAVPARKVRLRAAAAVLALCVLGIGVFLIWRLHRWIGSSPTDPGDTTEDPQTAAPEPENCRLVTFPDGESVWVLDREYRGDYDVQTITFPSSEERGSPASPLLPSDSPVYAASIPEGFRQEAILDYGAYAAWCAEFADYGLAQTYTDPESRYLVLACAEEHAALSETVLADVIAEETSVTIWFLDQFMYGFQDSAAYVLTVPVPLETETLNVEAVYRSSDLKSLRLWHSTELTENPDGTVDLHGWNVGTRFFSPAETASEQVYLLLFYGSEKILLQTDLNADEPLWNYESGIELLAENCVPMEPRAEGYDRWYQAETVRVLSLSEATQFVTAKPVIYLYPDAETRVEVKLDLDGELACTYPAYEEGWTVTAAPDGTLTDDAGQTYNYLYWEGTNDGGFDFSRGFCVAGADTAAFLEDALARLGLTRREANEFIVYWLPLMQDNPYNLITFQGAAYTDGARLEVSPAPDTVLRVFMAWTPLEAPVEIEPQDLTAPERTGFTVVEWGGSRVER